jgi:hypothetical protein
VPADLALDEKRVYADRRPQTTVFVGSALGVTRVDAAGDQVGRFSLVRRGVVRTIAGADGRLVVGTDEDVLVGTGDGFAPTDFGRAAVVSLADGRPVAAAPDGTVARLAGDEWVSVGSVTNPRRADGDPLVAADGVYRVGDELTALGGDGIRDVAAAGPYAAAAAGVLRYDGTWSREFGTDCTIVAADGDRVHAVSDEGLLVRTPDGEGESWQVRERPVAGPLADIAHGETLYAVTADGTMLVHATPDLAPDGQGGWRSRELGVRDVAGLAVP